MSTDPTDPRPDDPTAPAAEDAPTAVHGTVPAGDGGGPPTGPSDGPTPGGAAEPVPPGLYRSVVDRMLFGVCGGIAERYRFEPLLVRLVFLATLLVGGAGVLFYLAAALLIPAAPADAGPDGRPSGPTAAAATGVLRVLVGLAAAIGILAVLCAIAGVTFGVTAFFGAWPVGLLLAVLAVLLVASAGSRRATGTLLVVALALAVPATAAVVGGVDIDRSVGKRIDRPVTAIGATAGFRLGVGDLVVDLRDLPVRRGDHLVVPARVDVGRLGVVLPRDRCVAWTVRTRTGVVGGASVLSGERGGRDWSGTGGADRTVEVDPPHGRRDRRPQVTLDLRDTVGEIVVAHTRDGLDRVGDDATVLRRSSDVVRTTACRAADREQRRR